RMQPKVAVLKPLSSAISIGSGGPFGAEGPIIMTGGAFGSIFGQLLHLTAAERKTLLVAGAAGGMAATFATPVAAVLLAVELLLFEWKPRSRVPVALLHGRLGVGVLVPLIVVKGLIWATALGSGTSGGVLAPLLIMGGAAGALSASFLPGGDGSLWPLVGMAAVMGGTMRSPLTGAVFALELTNDVSALPALLIASVVSYGFTVLVMKRSILTEKVARRGYHVSREYSVDPLERVSI